MHVKINFGRLHPNRGVTVIDHDSMIDVFVYSPFPKWQDKRMTYLVGEWVKLIE